MRRMKIPAEMWETSLLKKKWFKSCKTKKIFSLFVQNIMKAEKLLHF
jgi:hypothetical protein